MILSQQVVAPFSGIAVLTDTDNEIMIINSGELPPGSEMIITNIAPIEEIQHPEDKLYVEKKVRLWGSPMAFHALTFAGFRESCLNTKPRGRVFKCLPRDPANVIVMK